MPELELWGGHECTVNRVGDHYIDQNLLSGHQHRIEDLEKFAQLGIRRLRYPLIWERAAPDAPDQHDWRWTDERLEEIRRLGMAPIAGLLHHGSGPRYTSLVSDNFVELFAAYARAAAERYPWVEDWTPVNEPLTTARFSTLYGHWYPHAHDERSFWTAFLNQVEGVMAAMREIRAVNANARLVQTEDLGQTHSTPPLADQAAHENIRRWLTWDLLTGRVNREHRFWPRLKRFGLTERIKRLNEAPCPPDVLGVNHYLTSERFLDHRVERYPEHRVGGNEHVRYADVEAVRVLNPGPIGLAGLLEQTWERYGLPMAVTESHNGCTREEQMRWIWDAWRSCQSLRARCIDVRAVTPWALLGSYDWNSLLTRLDGHYEVGAFDLRGGEPRPTAVTEMIKVLGAGGEPHPALQSPGWWRRDVRLEFQPVMRTAEILPARRHWEPPAGAGRPILIVGATGTLGQALARNCEWRGLSFVLTRREQLALDDAASIARTLEQYEPWAVINAAGWVRVDEAEADPDDCIAANATGAVNLARACAEAGTHYTAFSSDLVFDGRAERPYVESDAPNPMNVYGRSKAEMERLVAESGARALIVRTAAFFSPDDPYNFAAAVVRQLRAGRAFKAAADQTVTPTYVPDLVQAVLDLVVDQSQGVWHLSNHDPMTWAEFAREVARALELPTRLVRGVAGEGLGFAAPRPAYAALGTERGRIMPGFGQALARYAQAVSEGVSAAEADLERRREAGDTRVGCVA
ncbi:MAG TPA: family 1 glycosylhydrolase [Caulobacteraceae bacterium]